MNRKFIRVLPAENTAFRPHHLKYVKKATLKEVPWVSLWNYGKVYRLSIVMFSRCQGDRHVCDCQLNLPRSNGNTRLEKTSTDNLDCIGQLWMKNINRRSYGNRDLEKHLYSQIVLDSNNVMNATDWTSAQQSSALNIGHCYWC